MKTLLKKRGEGGRPDSVAKPLTTEYFLAGWEYGRTLVEMEEENRTYPRKKKYNEQKKRRGFTPACCPRINQELFLTDELTKR